MLRFLTLTAASLLLVAPAQAETRTYTLDKPHTQVLFNINHLGFSTSWGKFTDYQGTIQYNKDKPAESKVDVTIKTTSLDLGDATWNEHVSEAKYLNVAQHPEMRFKSTKIDVTGADTAKITGDLTLNGVTKPVTLDTKLVKAGTHPMSGKDGIGLSATGSLKRSDFGIVESVPYVADTVNLVIEVEAYDDSATKPAAN